MTFEEELLSEQRRLTAFALRLSGNREHAKDLVQETFLRALSRREKYKPDAPMRHWLFTILHNLFRDAKNRQARDRNYQVWAAVAIDVAIPASQDTVVQLHTVLASMARLPPIHRTILMYAGNEFSHEEVAAIEGIPLGTVKSRCTRARERLQYELDMSIGETIL